VIARDVSANATRTSDSESQMTSPDDQVGGLFRYDADQRKASRVSSRSVNAIRAV
jgi:hypothetical protein